MMGRLKSDQGQLFYEFRLGDAVPEDHMVRKIDTALDLSWLRSELAPHYSSMGRPSIDPELMIRMLVVGYVFAIRSERLICREVQVNLAYRWFCKLGIEDTVPDHSAFSRARNERFETSRRERKKIEMRFAHLERILKLGRLRLRGPRGAQDEFVLAAIAQKLRRLATLVARPPPVKVLSIA
jgi:transposase